MRRCWKYRFLTLLLLPLLLLVLRADAFGRPRSHKQQLNSRIAVQAKSSGCYPSASNKNDSSSDEVIKSTVKDLDPHYSNCGFVRFGFVQKIPYRNTPQSGCSPLDINLSSACIRCGICMVIAERVSFERFIANKTDSCRNAVLMLRVKLRKSPQLLRSFKLVSDLRFYVHLFSLASLAAVSYWCHVISMQINQSLIEAHNIMDYDQWLDEEETHLFLRAICDHEFRHYTLREYDGERYIGDSTSIPGATPVTSNVDGLWEPTLRNKCHDVLDDAGTQQLYKHWRDWCNGETAVTPLVDALCRSSDSGRLRDCQNMNCNAKKIPATADLYFHPFDWHARVKAELSSE